MKEKIRKVYYREIPENSAIILQIKGEEWFGEFVDVTPSKKIPTKSILKVIIKVYRIFLNFASTDSFFFEFHVREGGERARLTRGRDRPDNLKWQGVERRGERE